MYRVLALFALLCASMLPTAAKASCTTEAPGGQPYEWLFSGFSTGSFNPDAFALGAVIASRTQTPSAIGPQDFTCTPSIGELVFKGTTAPTPGPYSAYPTSIPGIGVRISISVCQPGGAWPITMYMYLQQSSNLTTTCPYTVELIKTGSITAGGALRGEFGGIFGDDGRSQVYSLKFSSDVIVTPTVPTCAPTVADKIVSLGQASAQDFATVGATAGTPVSFGIDLVCSGGVPTTRTTNLYVTFTDSTNPTNTTDILGLTATSTASGVGVQILKGATPVKYGPDSSAAGNTNQWFVATTANGNLSIPLTARYVRTGTVTAGRADALATFTFSYQ